MKDKQFNEQGKWTLDPSTSFLEPIKYYLIGLPNVSDFIKVQTVSKISNSKNLNLEKKILN